MSSRRTARRRVRLAALALVLGLPVLGAPALAAASAAPVTASDEESEAPEEESAPPELPGLEPVDGGSSGDQATDITAGRYVDVLPEGPRNADEGEVTFNIYDFERTIPGSIVRWGLTLEGEGVRASTRVRGLMVRPIGTEETQRCGALVRSPSLYPTSLPVASFAGTSYTDNAACRDAEVLRIGIFAGSSAAPPPGTPYELSVWEVPPPENLEDLSFPSQNVGTERVAPVAPEEVTTAIEPGPTKQEATRLPEEDGGVHVDLPLGRVSWFAVPVETNALLGVDAAVDDVERVDQGAALEVAIVAPEGGFVGDTIRGTEGSAGTFDPLFARAGVVGTGTSHVQAQTYTVGPGAYKNLGSGDFNGGGLFAAGPMIGEGGLYYVAVYAQDLTGEEGATLPMTLTIGRPQPESGNLFGVEPEYDGDQPDPLPGPVSDVEPTDYDGAAATEELRQQASEDEQVEEQAVEDGSVPWWAYVLGVLLVLAIAAGAFLLARGRSRRTTGGHRVPQGPHYPQGPPYQQGPPPGGWQPGPGGPGPAWGPPQGPQGPPPGPQGPPTPPTQIRQGPHPGQSGEGPTPWSGRPGQPQRAPEQSPQQPPAEPWSPPDDDADGRR